MKRWSLRARLLFWSAAVVAVTLIVFGAGSAWNLHRRLFENLDSDLRDQADDFYDTLEKHEVHWNDRNEVEYLFDIDLSNGSRYMEISRADGTMLYRSRTLKNDVIGLPRTPGTIATVPLRDREARVAVFQKDGIMLIVGEDANPLNSIVMNLLAAYALALPIVLLTVGLGGWWIARQALAPIETIITRARSITASRLDERLPQPLANDEIGRLTVVLNTMFDRLEGSFQQVAQFTTDASHELKTPLAIMRGELETALQSGRFNDEQERVLLSLLEETTHLAKITANLLLLSRADAGKLQLAISPVNLSTLIADVVEDMAIAAAPRAVSIRAELEPNLEVSADPHQLRQVLLNLLDNAIKYNHESGQVRLVLTRRNGQTELVVGNTGHGIAPEQVRQIFQRFYRGDLSHNSRVEGHGLGLSICVEIARAHGGTLTLLRSDDEWTEFCLTLPKANADAKINAF